MVKPKFYGVRKGRRTGVYKSWKECQAQVTGFHGSEFKSFTSENEAWNYLKTKGPKTFTHTSKTSTPVAAPADLPLMPAFSGVINLIEPLPEASHENPQITTINKFETASIPPYTKSSPSGSLFNVENLDNYPLYKSTPENPIQEIYTDGSCLGNGQQGARAGWGMFWGDKRDAYGSIEKATNNAGELMAIKQALLKILEGSKSPTYIIFSDSQYSISGLTEWTEGWIRKGWKTSQGHKVENQELFKDNLALMQVCSQKGFKIKLEKIKAHANIPGNEFADQLAKLGASGTPQASHR